MQLRAIVAIAATLAACDRAPDTHNDGTSLSELLAAADIVGYERASEVRELRFPSDHYSHPGFKTEWWYFTGNLNDELAEPFGFQLTFFRFAVTPDELQTERWQSRAVWMGHFAITDIARKQFYPAERLSRDGLALAGGASNPFRLWIEDWSATGMSADPFPLSLRASDGSVALSLELDATKKPVAQGQLGLDRKGPEPGNASYYYSMPRLSASGKIRIGDTVHTVTGTAWMDREWSSNALDPSLEGWDWLALELSDGRDLMLYRLRTLDGASSPFSSGTLIDGRGNPTRLANDDFTLMPTTYWTSAETGSRYPIAWTITIPAAQLDLEVAAAVPGQEMNLAVRYWEGAVEARGRSDGVPISARGYLELTGY